ncbi:MAG: hypothetical protein D3923_03160 [Candidatus Electrothrix sp. AR3]|nr:hypothetical protein [Candidatus Electrothrix sp. AR3]
MAKRRLISFDWAMKKLMRSKVNFEILEGFLSELLRDDIHILEILESESNKEDTRDKFNREDYVYHGSTVFRGIHHQDVLRFSEGQQELYGQKEIHEIFPEYYLIKVNSFDDIAKDSLDEWIYFLKNEEIKEEFSAKGLAKAKSTLDVLKLPEPERAAYERYQEDLHYRASMVHSSYYLGRKEKALEIARNLIDVLDDQTIAVKTGLSMEEIARIRQ